MPVIARALWMQGVRTTVATTDDDGPGARLDVAPGQITANEQGVETIYFRKDTEFYKVSFGVHRWLRRHIGEFDAVHIHALFSFSSVAAARSARRARVPYVVRPLGVLNRWGVENRRRLVKRWSLRYVERPILLHAAALHFTSEAEKREAIETVPEAAGVPSAVIPLPVEVPRCSVGAKGFWDEFPAAREGQVILFLSRIDPKKGVELLLEVFQSICTRIADALLVIAGGGEAGYVRSLKLRAEQMGIDDRIIWTGFLAGERKAAAFAAATVFVLPSYSENFGIAAAEALAAGVPSVLSHQVGLADEVANAGAAIVTRCDVRELADAIELILCDDRIRNELATKAKAFVQSYYSLEAVGEQLVTLYRRVINRADE